MDGKCVGESAPDVYFYTDVKGEFSPNTLELTMDAGTNYYVRQYIKMGVLVGGAGLEQVSEEQGKKDIAPLGLATQGHSSGSK